LIGGMSLECLVVVRAGGGGGRSGTVVGGPPDTSFGFYLREAFQSQTSTEKILYNKSR